MLFDSLILDIDGTIWNTTPIVAGAWNNAIDDLGFDAKKVTPEILQKEFGKPMNVIAQDLWPNLSDENKEKLMAQCCIREHEFLEKNQKDITYSGVIETIKELSNQIDFYVVSNCQSGYIELTLKKTGLDSYIKDFTCFGDTGKSKGENIKAIVEKNHLKNPAYIGDTQGDLEACNFANVPFIYASYGFGNPENFHSILAEFSDIKKILL